MFNLKSKLFSSSSTPGAHRGAQIISEKKIAELLAFKLRYLDHYIACDRKIFHTHEIHNFHDQMHIMLCVNAL